MFSIVTCWHEASGGMEIHGKFLSEGLVKRGHEVSIISTRHPKGKVYDEINGVKIYYLERTAFGSRRGNWQVESVRKFSKLHRETPFDIILSQSFAAYGLKVFRNIQIPIPIVPMLQGCINLEINSFKNNARQRYWEPLDILKTFLSLLFSYFMVQKPLLFRSNRIIVASNELIGDLRRFYGLKVADKSVAIFNGIDANHFSPNPEYRKTLRIKFGIEDHEMLLLSLGTLNREKGHHLALEALLKIRGKHPNTKLMIVGKGEDQNSLVKQVDSLRLKQSVLFPGFAVNRETVKYYNAADIFLMPTLRIEGLPFVLLEAMSCAKPVIASKIGGNTSVIKDCVNGLLNKPGNVSDIVKKVFKIVDNPRLANKLANSARKTILDDFSVEQMIASTEGIMKALVSIYASPSDI